MQLTAALRDMLGDQLADAVDAARDRLADDTVMARCNAGQWLIERNGVTEASDLDYGGAVAAIAALA